METSDLVNLYTLCSDVQRNADDLHQNVRSLLLDRLHHDQPIHGQYVSVQRTSRRPEGPGAPSGGEEFKRSHQAGGCTASRGSGRAR